MNDCGVQWWQQVGQYRAVADRPLMHKDTDMKIDKMLTSKYLKQSDVDGEITVTVKGDVKKVNVARDDEDPEYRYTIGFYEFDKPMVLNPTNIKRMAKALGDDTAGWDGNQVVLYVDENVEFGGNVVGGLRIKGLPRNARPQSASVDDVNRKLRDAEEDAPF